MIKVVGTVDRVKGWLTATQPRPRRVWTVFLFIIAAVPAAYALFLPLPVSTYTRDFYTHVNALPRGSVVVFGNTLEVPPVAERDFYRAALSHLAERGLKIILLNFAAGGVAASEYIVKYSKIEEKFDYKYGVDYVTFPYLAGDETAMATAAADFRSAYATDVRATPVKDIPLMRDVYSMKDIKLAIGQYGIFTYGDMYARQWPVKYGNILLIIGQYYGIAGHYGRNVLGNIDNTARAFAEYEYLTGYPGEELTKMESVNLQAFLVLGMIVVVGVMRVRDVLTRRVKVEA